MALIRQSDMGVRARGAVVLDLGDLGRQADALCAGARAEAERIIADARAERGRLVAGAAEHGKREGLARGLEEGRAAGRTEGRDAALVEHRAALEAIEKGWGEALKVFESERDRMIVEGRRDVVALAAAVAERVTKRVVALDPSVVEGQLGALLELVLRPTRLKVGVHPADMERAKGALAALCARIEAARHVELTPDETVGRGSCVARTGAGDDRRVGGLAARFDRRDPSSRLRSGCARRAGAAGAADQGPTAPAEGPPPAEGPA